MKIKTFLLLIVVFSILLGALFYYGFQLYFNVMDAIINPICPETIFLEPTYLKTELLGYRIITAYSSTIDQTDSTPFITANGTRVRRGIVATNELPFGQMIMIEGVEGIFIVADRTNKKYDFRIDIWVETREEALQFGRQTREITLLIK